VYKQILIDVFMSDSVLMRAVFTIKPIWMLCRCYGSKPCYVGMSGTNWRSELKLRY